MERICPFLKGIGIVGNHNGSLCLSETGEWLHRNLSFIILQV